MKNIRQSITSSMYKKIILLFLVIGISACSGLETKPEQFKVNISNMKMLESSLMEQRYEVKLRIMNRGKGAVSIDGMSFDIELNGKDFASGVSNEKIKIDSFSENIITVNVTSTIFGIIRQINSFKKLKSKPLKYEISGHIYTSSGLFGIPFSEKGEVDLKPSQVKI